MIHELSRGVFRLIAGNAFAGAGLFEAVAKAADHRGLKPGPLSERITSLVELRGRVYREWRRRLGPDGEAYPEDFAEVVAEVIGFADPLLAGEVAGADWDPKVRSWRR